MADSVESLARRVARLERSNFILKIVNVGVVAAVVALGQLPSIMALTPVKLISAQKFNLVNAAGATLASWAPNANGSVITFYDTGGKKTVAVGMQADGVVAGMETFDGNAYVAGTGVTRSTFGEASASATTPGVGLGVFDGSGKFRASLGTNLDASTGSDVLFYDPTGTVSSGVGYFPDSNVTGLFTHYSSSNNNNTSTFFGGTLDDKFAIGESFDHGGMLRSGFDVDYVNDFEGFFSKYPTEPVANENNVIAGSAIDAAYGPYVGVFDDSANAYLRAFMGFGGATWPEVWTADPNGKVRAGISTDNVNNFNGFFDLDGDATQHTRYIAGTPFDASWGFSILEDPTAGTGRAGLIVDYPGLGAGTEQMFLNNPSDLNQAIVTAVPVTGGTVFTYNPTGTQTGHLP